ncbi:MULTISPECIES: hypothetical protein [Burkholderia cepacia complex]|uniref:Uncharacterized protein n=1 Tax=Burkholderia contaminans TaxID=488447 RepID=A0A6P3BJV4_9BURK|nr:MULTISPECIES: hypothetical protein [Burkholderia cepacia complex]VWD58933.1 hypothetical protein BCO71033_06265 [Burkholderia contaminans]
MAQVTLWGSVQGNGTVVDGSGGFTVKRESTGTYQLSFSTAFIKTPAATASQWGYGGGQNTLDNVIFPALSGSGATIQTGDANGKYTDRNFSFVIIGTIN